MLKQYLVTIAHLLTVAATAQTVVQDGFESGVFAAGWGLTAGVSITNTGGANGSTRLAQIGPYTASTGRELGARWDTVALEGARDFLIDCAIRTQNTTQRQFHLHVSTSTGGISSSAPALSVRYQASQGGWAAYDGATWQTISGLNTLTADQWYRLRVIGQGWGTSAARFALQVSDAGTTNLTGSASNLVWFQGGTPTANTARFFVFTTVFGNNPGFGVDEVSAGIISAAPPVTNAIVNISGTYPHLAVFSPDGEAGIGAVMPWANKLWFVTYPPSAPNGSADKLWMLETNLTLAMHPTNADFVWSGLIYQNCLQ